MGRATEEGSAALLTHALGLTGRGNAGDELSAERLVEPALDGPVEGNSWPHERLCGLGHEHLAPERGVRHLDPGHRGDLPRPSVARVHDHGRMDPLVFKVDATDLAVLNPHTGDRATFQDLHTRRLATPPVGVDDRVVVDHGFPSKEGAGRLLPAPQYREETERLLPIEKPRL